MTRLSIVLHIFVLYRFCERLIALSLSDIGTDS